MTLTEIPTANVDFSDESISDLHALLRELRSQSPMWWVRLFGRNALLVLSYDLVQAAFADERALPGATTYRDSAEKAMGRMLLSMEGEQHRLHRAMISPPFRLGVVTHYTDMISSVATSMIEEIAPQGAADLVAVFTKRFPLRVIMSLLGLPPDCEEDLAGWAWDLIRFQYEPEAALSAKARFTEFLTPIIEDRRREPRGDLISTVVHAEIEGERLDDEDVCSFIRLLFPAGADTTYLAMGNVLLGVLSRPEQLALAKSQPEQRRAIVEEALRLEPSTGLQPRTSPPDRAVEWQGLHLEPATPMLLGIMAANRDPEIFRDPDLFDRGRTSANPVTTFGFGTHFCVGKHLAIAELTIGFSALLDGLPGLRLEPDPNARVHGTILRGANRVPVRWETAST